MAQPPVKSPKVREVLPKRPVAKGKPVDKKKPVEKKKPVPTTKDAFEDQPQKLDLPAEQPATRARKKRSGEAKIRSTTPAKQLSVLRLAQLKPEQIMKELGSVLGDRKILQEYLRIPRTKERASFFERTGVLPDEALSLLARLDDNMLDAAVESAKARDATLGGVLDTIAYIRSLPGFTEFGMRQHCTEHVRNVMRSLVARLSKLEDWTVTAISNLLTDQSEQFDEYPSKSLAWLLIAEDTLPLSNALALLGKQESVKRYRQHLS